MMALLRFNGMLKTTCLSLFLSPREIQFKLAGVLGYYQSCIGSIRLMQFGLPVALKIEMGKPGSIFIRSGLIIILLIVALTSLTKTKHAVWKKNNTLVEESLLPKWQYNKQTPVFLKFWCFTSRAVWQSSYPKWHSNILEWNRRTCLGFALLIFCCNLQVLMMFLLLLPRFSCFFVFCLFCI
jgi:hypothetical protein